MKKEAEINKKEKNIPNKKEIKEITKKRGPEKK